jgi:hypothetical protein
VCPEYHLIGVELSSLIDDFAVAFLIIATIAITIAVAAATAVAAMAIVDVIC